MGARDRGSALIGCLAVAHNNRNSCGDIKLIQTLSIDAVLSLLYLGRSLGSSGWSLIAVTVSITPRARLSPLRTKTITKRHIRLSLHHSDCARRGAFRRGIGDDAMSLVLLQTNKQMATSRRILMGPPDRLL